MLVGADANWIIGSTLIDCKTAENLSAPWLHETLFQVLGHARPDFDDRLTLRRLHRVESLLAKDATWTAYPDCRLAQGLLAPDRAQLG